MVDETVDEIRELQTHSSSVVAVKAARALKELLTREFATVDEFQRALGRNSDALRRASPSHASLWTTQQAIIDAVKESDPETVGEAKASTDEQIDRVIEQVEAAKQRAAEEAVSLIPDEGTVLTHDYSSTVLIALELAAEHLTELTVYVTEARPRFIGRRTARELGMIPGITPRLIVDSAVGFYLEQCDRVLLGMDCIVEETLYNRVGTYPIAVTAVDQGVPVNVVGSSAKLVTGGFVFENEFRSVSEVIREPPVGFEVCNPAYDATPTRLLESVITDDGVQTI